MKKVLIYSISQIETQTTTPIIEPSAVSSLIPPLSIRTCEGNELLPTTDIPPPLYTSPIGSATTITVQTFPIDEAIVGVADVHDLSIHVTVNSLTTEYNEPMDACSVKVKDFKYLHAFPIFVYSLPPSSIVKGRDTGHVPSP